MGVPFEALLPYGIMLAVCLLTLRVNIMRLLTKIAADVRCHRGRSFYCTILLQQQETTEEGP